MNTYRETSPTITNFNDAMFSDDYETYLITTDKELNLPLTSLNYAFFYQLSPEYYIVAVKSGLLDSLRKAVPEIIEYNTSYSYTLNASTPFEQAHISKLNSPEFIGLRGDNTVAAIIDTGIDYLNPQFWDDNGNSRILSIWDQSINSGLPQEQVPFGTFYTNEQINHAIEAFKIGKDPYEIVASRDTNGHGTELAGLVGAKGIEGIIGGAPECKFVIIKLKEIKNSDMLNAGIVERTTNIYGGLEILMAIRFCFQQKNLMAEPMAVLMGFGTNGGGHDGVSSIERFIDLYGQKIGLIFVTGTGNEGASDTHASLIIDKKFKYKSIDINVGKDEKNLSASVWVNAPNIISAGLVSPSGEIISPVPAKIIKNEKYELIFEETTVEFTYYLNEYTTGDENIIITFKDPEEGVWQLRFKGDFVTSGNINVWLPQRALLKPETRFLDADPNITLQTPSTSDLIITTANYNQNNNSMVPSSGKGFTRNNQIKPLLATGGVSALTTGLDNKTVVVSGSSVAAAVLCSAVLLLLEWGIALKNDPTMYGKNIQSYLARGATKRPGDIYPNPEWGWGFLNLEDTFANLRSYDSYSRTINLEYISNSLLINIPKDLYFRLIKPKDSKGGLYD